MVFRFLFLLTIMALAVCGAYFIVQHLQQQSANTFYGSAETETRTINLEFPVIIQEIRVVPGKAVKAGDTLAVTYRAEFDRKITGEQTEINQLGTTLNASINALQKERALTITRYNANITELESKIKVYQTEENVQKSIRDLVSNNQGGSSPINAAQISALQAAIQQEKDQLDRSLSLVDAKINAEQSIYQAKVVPFQQNMRYLSSDREKLIVLAPIDGFVEQILIGKNEMVQSYRELFKISASKPVRVICFLHETEKDIPIQPGDSVTLSSTARPTVMIKSVVSGSTPKLVELPTRLRKFAEIKTWGREMFVHLPTDNPFYIGEKILISTTL